MTDHVTDRAMSESAMLASLRDIHLPEMDPGGIVADIAVTFGLAGLAALMVGGLLRMVSLRHKVRTGDTLQDELDRLRHQPEAQRRVALLHLLRSRAPERFAQVKGTLYRPGGGIPTDALEAELARLV